jgi:hypothetical protein
MKKYKTDEKIYNNYMDKQLSVSEQKIFNQKALSGQTSGATGIVNTLGYAGVAGSTMPQVIVIQAQPNATPVDPNNPQNKSDFTIIKEIVEKYIKIVKNIKNLYNNIDQMKKDFSKAVELVEKFRGSGTIDDEDYQIIEGILNRNQINLNQLVEVVKGVSEFKEDFSKIAGILGKYRKMIGLGGKKMKMLKEKKDSGCSCCKSMSSMEGGKVLKMPPHLLPRKGKGMVDYFKPPYAVMPRNIGGNIPKQPYMETPKQPYMETPKQPYIETPKQPYIETPKQPYMETPKRQIGGRRKIETKPIKEKPIKIVKRKIEIKPIKETPILIGKSKKPNARAEIVRQVMRERGLSMIEASSYVKQKGLYSQK